MNNPMAFPANPLPLWDRSAPEPDGVPAESQPDLQPFPVNAGVPSGAVIICPGGGYSYLAPHEGAPVAGMFNRAGLSAFVLRYRIAPHRHPAPLADLQRAVRLVRARAADWGVKPDRIAVLGFSAGGHLAATAVTHYDAGHPEADDPVERVSCRPDAGILCYAVISFGEFGHGGSRVNLIGEAPPDALIESLSNERQVTPDTPPCFVWHTAADRGVPVENSLLFASALRRAGVPFALHVFESGGHGLGLAPGESCARAWPELCVRWLKARGF